MWLGFFYSSFWKPWKNSGEKAECKKCQKAFSFSIFIQWHERTRLERLSGTQKVSRLSHGKICDNAHWRWACITLTLQCEKHCFSGLKHGMCLYIRYNFVVLCWDFLQLYSKRFVYLGIIYNIVLFSTYSVCMCICVSVGYI